MKKIILLCLLLVLNLALTSCDYEARITIQNKVHNATLERVSWDDYSIAYSLMPGEKSSNHTIHSYKSSDFPKTSVVKFYMKRDGNQVYLETKNAFTFTEVINPILQSDE